MEAPSFEHLRPENYTKFDEKQLESLENLTRFHIDSFNWMVDSGLQHVINKLSPVEFALKNGSRVSYKISDIRIVQPSLNDTKSKKIYPKECRERHTTYSGKISVRIDYSHDGKHVTSLDKIIGQIPIMVKSKLCNLYKLKPKEMVEKGEEKNDLGGYFIVRGNEKLLRLLIMPRRNYPMAMIRPSWKSRGATYTEYGITIRCVGSDQIGQNHILHYLDNGGANLCFPHQKEIFFIPTIMILKGLVDMPDYEIYRRLMLHKESNSFMEGCIKFMMRQLQQEEIYTKSDVLTYIGSRFRVKLGLPDWYSDHECANFLFNNCLFTHLEDNSDKFNLLIFMLRKLYALVHQNGCKPDDPDSPMMQEILLPGHLYLGVLSERLESYLMTMKSVTLIMDSKKPFVDGQKVNMAEAFKRETSITNAMEYFLATGNLRSKHGLGILQTTGFSIIADKLNYMRYLSHFRSVHRGSIFTEIRTTSVRKLTPESWGFFCPVHTPDGALCGLLNHLTFLCEICTDCPNDDKLVELLKSMGMNTLNDAGFVELNSGSSNSHSGSSYLDVVLNGRLIGHVHTNRVDELKNKLRYLKALATAFPTNSSDVSKYMEICHLPRSNVSTYTLYPGLYLFTTPGRMMRPVRNLHTNQIEYIGTLEQCYLHVCISPKEFVENKTTHQELYPYSFMSVMANLTPFSEYNQSPRNMYQCQMGKQTMGTPCHSIQNRTDNKLYRLNFPQSPLVRTKCYDYYNIDDYPIGTNAIVAVVSYTGYDMEDAMVLNKASFERGFAHGTIYSTEIVDLNERSRSSNVIFSRDPRVKALVDVLDEDGLPRVGAFVEPGSPFYCALDLTTGEYRVQSFKKLERAYIVSVRALGNDDGSQSLSRVAIMFSHQRNPIIGDKFSSRHGQKGICSRIYPMEDLPFTESGLTPDIIFNPHGFPSRMTIGMMIEFMAGKSAAIYGHAHDATPFQFDDKEAAEGTQQSPIDYYGTLLQKAGYSYYGTESMYNGITGRQLEVDIFFGVVYYQRLRHMVSDKFQARTTGPIDAKTHQPVKGRKREGGIRLGEMERDALIAHGAPCLIQDRLLNNSDKTSELICTKCGSFISIVSSSSSSTSSSQPVCLSCGRSNTIKTVQVPYVLKYLVAELASVNIKVKFDTEKPKLTSTVF